MYEWTRTICKALGTTQEQQIKSYTTSMSTHAPGHGRADGFERVGAADEEDRKEDAEELVESQEGEVAVDHVHGDAEHELRYVRSRRVDFFF